MRTTSNQPILTPLAHGALNHCFGCGLDNPSGLRLNFFTDPDHNIVCHTTLAPRFAGPPGHAHGGIIATLLDEAMSKANRARNILAMTRQMEVQYLRPIPLGVPLTLTARHLDAHGRAPDSASGQVPGVITGVSKRAHHCEAQIADASGQILATAKAVFITIAPDHLQKSLAAAKR